VRVTEALVGRSELDLARANFFDRDLVLRCSGVLGGLKNQCPGPPVRVKPWWWRR
jgi:hypothetical protein